MKKFCLQCRINGVKYPREVSEQGSNFCKSCKEKRSTVEKPCVLCKKNTAEYLGIYCFDCVKYGNWEGVYDNNFNRDKRKTEEHPDIFF